MNNLFAFGASVTGPSHAKSNLPNQDAFIIYNDDKLHEQIIALSDGHGSKRHVHSEIGSKIAVEVARDVISKYISHIEFQFSTVDISNVRYDFEEEISRAIQINWQTRIKEHYETQYVQFDEINSDMGQIAIQYGCTLLIAVAVGDLIVLAQLGDGKIVIVYDDGTVYFPIQEDERLKDNVTTSLSESSAWLEMKVQVLKREENIKLIGLFSDGVENAYPQKQYDDALFYIRLAKETLDETYSDKFFNLLQMASNYSKDDTTGVILIDPKQMDLNEAEVAAHGPMVWTSEIPIGLTPLVQKLSEGGLNKAVEYAFMVLQTYRGLYEPIKYFNKLSLKRIYIDENENQLVIFKSFDQNDHEAKGAMNVLNTLLYTLINLNNSSCFRPKSKNIRTPEEWMRTLDEIQSNIKQCYNCGSFQIQSENERCGKCSFDVSSKVSSKGANNKMEIFHNSVISLHQIMPLVGKYDVQFGKVIQHSKHQNIWGLVNISKHVWTVSSHDDREIPPGKVLSLVDGTTVIIYGIPVQIKVN